MTHILIHEQVSANPESHINVPVLNKYPIIVSIIPGLPIPKVKKKNQSL